MVYTKWMFDWCTLYSTVHLLCRAVVNKNDDHLHLSSIMVKTTVETVLGPIDANKLKKTLTHEHVVIDFGKHYLQPEKKADNEKANGPFALQNVNWIKHNPYSHYPNLFLEKETNAVIDDLRSFKEAGGSSIIENTTIGIGRDCKKIKHIAEASGVNIVCGTGYYVEKQLDEHIKAYSVEEMTQVCYIILFMQPITNAYRSCII